MSLRFIPPAMTPLQPPSPSQSPSQSQSQSQFQFQSDSTSTFTQQLQIWFADDSPFVHTFYARCTDELTSDQWLSLEADFTFNQYLNNEKNENIEKGGITIMDNGNGKYQMTLQPTAPCRSEITQKDIINGIDMQCIPWLALHATPEECRRNRLQRLGAHGPQKTHTLRRAWKVIKVHKRTLPCFSHNQLRHMIKCASNTDVFGLGVTNQVCHYSTTLQKQVILPTKDKTIAKTSMAVDRKTTSVFTGNLTGQIEVVNYETEKIVQCPIKTISNSDNMIINSIVIHNTHGGRRVIISNNDCFARCIDMPTFRTIRDYRTEEELPINYTAASDQLGVVAVCGDFTKIYLIDERTAGAQMTLCGHGDYVFSADFHPLESHTLASASQDGEVHIWDVRKPECSLHTVHGPVRHIRSVKYSPSGAFLAVGSEMDYVQVFDHISDYSRVQTWELFDNIVGVDWAPDGRLFFGIGTYVGLPPGFSHVRYGGLFEAVYDAHSPSFQAINNLEC